MAKRKKKVEEEPKVECPELVELTLLCGQAREATAELGGVVPDVIHRQMHDAVDQLAVAVMVAGSPAGRREVVRVAELAAEAARRHPWLARLRDAAARLDEALDDGECEDQPEHVSLRAASTLVREVVGGMAVRMAN